MCFFLSRCLNRVYKSLTTGIFETKGQKEEEGRQVIGFLSEIKTELNTEPTFLFCLAVTSKGG